MGNRYFQYRRVTARAWSKTAPWGTITYTYDAENRLIQKGDIDYSYDKDGNLLLVGM
ncbi:MAG: hypothetical protein LBS37_05675 [Treponema sp.]|nr:hypothetical protein [Treponema sp.]